jgi:hypothetical protein
MWTKMTDHSCAARMLVSYLSRQIVSSAICAPCSTTMLQWRSVCFYAPLDRVAVPMLAPGAPFVRSTCWLDSTASALLATFVQRWILLANLLCGREEVERPTPLLVVRNKRA